MVELRRETPPSFLSNFDVPDFIDRAIRQGEDLLRDMPRLAEDLSWENYQEKMDALLYCEEVDAAMELSALKMENIFCQHLSANLFSISVPGLGTGLMLEHLS